jgi:hypothetical protein
MRSRISATTSARGLAVADAGSSSPVDWTKIIHTNNVYTLLYYTQNSGTGWTLGNNEAIATEDSLFATPLLEYQLRVDNTTAVDRGADLSAFIDGDFSGLVRPQGLAWDIGAVELAQTGLTFITQPAGQTVPEGYPANFSAVTRGAAGYTLQWMKDSVALPGATGTSYFIPSVSAADKGIYTLQLTSADRQTTALSAPAGLNVNQPPYFAASPSPAQQIAPPGANVLYSVTVSGLPTPTLQWTKDAVALPGATATTLTLAGVTTASAGTYAVQATNSYGSVTSSGAQLIVGVPPTFTQNPSPASLTATPGSGISYSVNASGLPAPTLQWHKDGNALPGQTNATLVLPSVTSADSGTYSAAATNLAGSVVSANAVLTVATAPVFTTQPAPASQTVVTGSSVYYAVAVTAIPAATLQWRKDDQPITSATNASLTLSNISASDAGTYTVVATEFRRQHDQRTGRANDHLGARLQHATAEPDRGGRRQRDLHRQRQRLWPHHLPVAQKRQQPLRRHQCVALPRQRLRHRRRELRRRRRQSLRRRRQRHRHADRGAASRDHHAANQPKREGRRHRVVQRGRHLRGPDDVPVAPQRDCDRWGHRRHAHALRGQGHRRCQLRRDGLQRCRQYAEQDRQAHRVLVALRRHLLRPQR